MNCAAHLERAGIEKPAVRLELCADCLAGLPISLKELRGSGPGMYPKGICHACECPNDTPEKKCCSRCRQQARKYASLRRELCRT